MTNLLKSLLPKDSLSPLGLIAGRGDLPRTLLQAARENDRQVCIIAFHGQTDEDLVEGMTHVWLNLGEVGRGLTFLRTHGVEEIVMAGHMRRPSLTELRPDWTGAKWLAKLGAKALGDDSLLSSVVRLAEDEGFRVIGPDQILDSLLAPAGLLTQTKPDQQASLDIQRGLDVLKHLSLADVGQAVVVQQGIVLGVEGVEGTDALISRCAGLKRPGPAPVLVKQSKWNQERRIDLPTVGPDTVKTMIKAGVRGLAIEAGHTLMLHQEEMIKLADSKGIFITGIQGERCNTTAHLST